LRNCAFKPLSSPFPAADKDAGREDHKAEKYDDRLSFFHDALIEPFKIKLILNSRKAWVSRHNQFLPRRARRIKKCLNHEGHEGLRAKEYLPQGHEGHENLRAKERFTTKGAKGTKVKGKERFTTKFTKG